MDFDNEDMESKSGYIVSGSNISNGDGVGFGGQVCANVWGSIFDDSDGVGFDVGYNIDEIDNGVRHEIGVNMGGSVVGDIDCVRAETCPHVGGVMGDIVINMCSDNVNDEEEEDQDYIPSDEKGFDFVNEVEDDWIDNLLSDGSTRKTVYSALDLKNK